MMSAPLFIELLETLCTHSQLFALHFQLSALHFQFATQRFLSFGGLSN